MLKIRALNRESLSDEDAPGIRKEAQEEIALDMYNKALRLQCSGDLNEAIVLLNKLLEENIPQIEGQGGLPKTMSTIKYSCYINIGTIAVQLGEHQKALENLLIASELDKTDVTLWYKIGKLALKLDKFNQAVFAFSNGLECSEAHWPCLDNLITVLFAIQDTVPCLEYIGKALMLDAYYTKGVVLRKNIYDNNPATEAYYKLYNPNHIYEPKICFDVDEEDEKAILDEVQILRDRLNEVEKALQPKPLPTIPLTKSLEDYTWVALGKTLTLLHKYITGNNMSHLCKINLTKCMSNNGSDSVLPMEEVPEVLKEVEKEITPEKEPEAPKESVVVTEEKSSEKVDEPAPSNNENDEPMETSEVIERRLSQNSENDTGENNGDDNDEMEQEADDQEDNASQKRSLSKSVKRRRDLVSELQIWGWHSKRKSAKKAKSDKDYSIEQAFTRIIPLHLLPNGINSGRYNNIEFETTTVFEPDIVQQSNTEVENISNLKYFGSDDEKEDVKKFWNRNWENCDAIDLIEEYVYAVAEMWRNKWPKELIPLYIDAYCMFREHCDYPDVFIHKPEFDVLRKNALTTLLYGELITFCTKTDYTEHEVHWSALNHLLIISGWETSWGDEYLDFVVRVHWLRTHLFRQNNENSIAINSLQLIQEFLNPEAIEGGQSKKLKVYIHNGGKYYVISNPVIEKILTKLEMFESLSQLEDLYESKQYHEVAEILKATFHSNYNHMNCGKMGRPAQLGLLMHSLWYTDMPDCFIWTEESLNESLYHVMKASKDKDKWEMVLDKCLLIMSEIIKNETVSIIDTLSDEKRCRFVESLSILCTRQVNAEHLSKVTFQHSIPWILLHYILLRDEHRQQAKKIVKHIQKDDKNRLDLSKIDDEEDLPPSIAILFSAHEFLGPKGWCLSNQGELLHFMLDSIIYRLDTPIFETLRDKIDIHLEQAFFCLYQHPCKKNKVSRHLADHNINPLPLTWERAQQLYEFFCPDALPEFDSYKSISISSDLEQLLQRIIALVPKECDPQPISQKVSDFIHGNDNGLPEIIEFPLKIKAIYYLLGDYFFKQSEVKRSYKYFLYDLCINPDRIDSWADLALGIHSQLESKLNHCERFKSESEFLDKAKSARVCFREALKLNNSHVTLWIEFGSFEYMVHSYCSRVLKYESDVLSMEKFEILENEKENYLESSSKSFQQALELYQLDQPDADERWLYHYMLAKIAEKKQEDPNIYLQHYLSAAALLHENNCTYPDKINYNNPQHLSLEALEVHYRINASILKYLELHEGKIISSTLGKLFKKCLDSSIIQKSKYEVKANNKVETTASVSVDDNKIAEDVKSCVDDLIKQVIEKVDTVEEKNETAPAVTESDEVVMIDSDEDKKIEKPEFPKIKVRSIHEIMEEMMKDALDKPIEVTTENEMETDSVVAVTQPIEEPKTDGEDVQSEEKASSKSEEDENIRKSTTTATEDSSSSSSSSSSTSSSDSESEDSSSTTTSSSENSNENLTENEIINLVDRCIVGLEQCIRRLPQNYKALYRLAHIYFSYSKKKDLNRCKQLMLGEYKCKNSLIVNGLFSDRKTNNFFNGIWRIPSSEIDRPGSLSAHMGRCVNLLLQILRETNDHKTLLELCLQLRRIPDADKVYIRHCEREQLSEQALTMCIQTLRNQIKNIKVNSSSSERLVVDLYKAYQRSQKNLAHQEKVFAGMLIEAYKKIMDDKVPDIPNLLDLAIKYCQQSRVTEKLKKQQNPIPPKMPMLSAVPPVLPSPSILGSPIPTQPLKRPGLGRPRGRPPGPKMPGQIKSPRGRSPVTSSSNPFWNNPLFNAAATYDYIKQCQDELIRQYSQQLTMSQLTSLGSNLFTNPNLLSATAAVSNPLLNPTSLAQTMRQMTNTGINTMAANQLSQNLSQMNPNLLKKLSNQLAPTSTSSLLTNFNSDKLRQLTALAQTTSQPKLAHSSHSKSSHSSQSKSTKLKHTYGGSGKSSAITTTTASSATTFKYPPADVIKAKSKDTSKSVFLPNLSPKDIAKAFMPQKSRSAAPVDKTANLIKDRPNISITPVTAVTNTISTKMPTTQSSPGKTLQEKLADKQKQQQKSAAKTLDFGPKIMDPKTFPLYQAAHSNYPASQVGKKLDVIPNFLLDSGLSISQVQQKQTQPVTTSKSKSSASASSKALGMPISMSMVRKQNETTKTVKPTDDDVIIIE